MGGKHHQLLVAALALAASISGLAAVSTPAAAGSHADEVAAYWTPERVAAAQPRDLVVDQRGLGYLRGRDHSLSPYGHSIAPGLVQAGGVPASQPVARAKPPTGDTTAPTISNRSPAAGATVGTQVPFSATVTDQSGVASVSFVIHFPSGATQTFSAARGANNVWSTTISGFTNGNWGWHVVARDTARRGNTAISNTLGFTVDTDGGGGGGGGVVPNAQWTGGGDVQLAAGRILFEMPKVQGGNTTWVAYVCSGTVVTDTKADASIILTAAHCVYDDVAKQFARNVLFIPNQAGTTGAGTDTNCGNDPIGCWAPSYGVVDANWTTRTFPNNVEWDYAYYVVTPDSHTGNGPGGGLEDAVNELPIGFDTATAGGLTHALGYSYSEDPHFMYCSEPLGVQSAVNWWLGSCGLTGGASGGPWVEPMDTTTGTGPIISVNSWGYTNQPGMAGPLLDASAHCTFDAAVGSTGAVPSGSRGVVATC
jgi:hypothetical protein